MKTEQNSDNCNFHQGTSHNTEANTGTEPGRRDCVQNGASNDSALPHKPLDKAEALKLAILRTG